MLNPKDILKKALEIDSLFKRRLYIVACLTKLFIEKNLKPPVIIGGTALTWFSREMYATMDVDLACSNRKIVDEFLTNLSFKKEGRYWYHKELDIVIEIPTSNLAGEEAPLEEIEIFPGLNCFVLGLEDLIVDRLNAAVHWSSKIDSEMCRQLLKKYDKEIDWNYLENRTKHPENDTYNELIKLKKQL